MCDFVFSYIYIKVKDNIFNSFIEVIGTKCCTCLMHRVPAIGRINTTSKSLCVPAPLGNVCEPDICSLRELISGQCSAVTSTTLQADLCTLALYENFTPMNSRSLCFRPQPLASTLPFC